MGYEVKKAAVLGAGVMGAAIAAHLANVGIPVLLLDIPPKEGDDRNAIARAGLERALKAKPPAFYHKEFAELVEVGNFEDDMPKIAECDLVIEAIVENLQIKRSLFEKVDQCRKPGSIIATNTSGISINAIAEGRSEDFRKHFLGMHFFNPPRYMKLLEIIPGKDTLKEVVDFAAEFGEKVLGKGIVYAKDTPNFIANRIGVFGMMYTLKLMDEMGLTIEEIDALTGKVVGRPKVATFKLADMVGIDVLYHVALNVYDNAPNDEMREIFNPPEWLKKMVENGWLGNKTKQGFYKKVKGEDGKKQTLVIDPKTLEYRPAQRATFPSVEMAKTEEDVRKRLKIMCYGKDKGAQFTWKAIAAMLIYSANRIPEIADDIVQVDNAMKWGFNWELGPFEIWDAIGVRKSVERMEAEGMQVPAKVKEMLEAGAETFYREEGTTVYYWDFESKSYKPIEEKPEVIVLSRLKKAGKVVTENADASLIDLGDGVACLEFHTKMNAIGAGILQMVDEALDRVRKDFDALVIANQGEHFSAGANLALLLMAIQEEEWEEIDYMVRSFQKATMSLKYFEKPVVAAPFNMTLGGGCEFCLHCDRIRAHAELYMGLVEVGVGLLPAGGGTKEMLLRLVDKYIPKNLPRGVVVDPLPHLRRALETIAMAKVSMSAYEAKEIGFLTDCDSISINRDYLIHDAKQVALNLVREGYKPGRVKKVKMAGREGFGYLKMLIYNMKEGGWITEHEAKIATHIAKVLTGGDVLPGTVMDEWEILDLEREGFLSLCGEPKTQERIRHMLTTGRPLRN
ncbi:3-hydroxyacyl-CoA dehydrogenase/enoyl-CoA hydratase family protein [Thermosulfidibacter takaii]|nr:3-hydroxyacyl-CoA dehydrogenase/enoyl-CoA hydratase family protein [Thermosulfidibacter takaii]